MPQFSDDLFLGPAQTYMGTGIRPYTTTFTGAMSGTTLTVSVLGQGAPIVVGMYVDGSSVTDGTYITALARVLAVLAPTPSTSRLRPPAPRCTPTATSH